MRFFDDIRAFRTRKHLRLIQEETLYDIRGLPEYFYAPPTDVSRFDNERNLIKDNGWFCIKPQDRRITDEERYVLASIEKRFNA